MSEVKLTLLNAIRAQCWDCLGHYADGREDCANERCPLYNWMPYRDKTNKPDLWWLKYNPRRKGEVTWEDSKPNLTEEQREANKQRLASYRKNHESK